MRRGEKDSIKLQKGETIAYRWISESELKQMTPDVLLVTSWVK